MTQAITAEEIRNFMETFVRDYPAAQGIANIWRPPLTAFAAVDDRFDVLPGIAAPDHALPADLLPGARTVIVFFVPFIRALAEENHAGDTPCRNWGLAYETTNTLINLLCAHIQKILEAAGHRSARVPATHNFDHDTLMARWSHKHLGYIAGLGRFGVNAQLITPSGCAGRLGSLVTNAGLGNHSLIREKELCLHRRGKHCLLCVQRCPVGAVSETAGIHRKKCWARLRRNLATLEALTGLAPTTHVCGKCQVLLPCSLGIPRATAGRPPA